MFPSNAVQASGNRRKNLHRLANDSGSQTTLANKLRGGTITQPHISLIISGKRPLTEFEAREIERDLNIPIGWMDIGPWASEERQLLKKYEGLDVYGKKVFNELFALLKKRVSE